MMFIAVACRRIISSELYVGGTRTPASSRRTRARSAADETTSESCPLLQIAMLLFFSTRSGVSYPGQYYRAPPPSVGEFIFAVVLCSSRCSPSDTATWERRKHSLESAQGDLHPDNPYRRTFRRSKTLEVRARPKRVEYILTLYRRRKRASPRCSGAEVWEDRAEVVHSSGYVGPFARHCLRRRLFTHVKPTL